MMPGTVEYLLLCLFVRKVGTIVLVVLVFRVFQDFQTIRPGHCCGGDSQNKGTYEQSKVPKELFLS
jgi:hypothetical protein